MAPHKQYFLLCTKASQTVLLALLVDDSTWHTSSMHSTFSNVLFYWLVNAADPTSTADISPVFKLDPGGGTGGGTGQPQFPPVLPP